MAAKKPGLVYLGLALEEVERLCANPDIPTATYERLDMIRTWLRRAESVVESSP
jgi:hypothetical protein